MLNTVDAFRQAAEKDGLALPENIVPGRIVRFPGIGKSNGNTSGWAWLSKDGQGGAYGDWASGLSDTWHAHHDHAMTAAERAAHTRRVAELRRIREEEEANQHAEAAKRAQTIWGPAAPAPEDHPYLQKKGIQPHGLRVDDANRLIVPATIDGALSSLQFIDANGGKLFLPGGAVKGASFTLGVLSHADTLLLCEGFATGASLHEATGLPVVVAFSAGNLTPVAEQLRQQCPTATIVVCGDQDLSGTGQREARQAAEAVSGLVVLPETVGMDFNDIHVQHGLDAVKKTIEAARTREEERPTMTTTTAEADTHTDSWPQLDETAFYGLAGEFTHAVEPYSEADPMGILLNVLLPAGAVIGPLPHVLVEHTPHYARTNALIVGVTAGGRKGTSWGPSRYLLSKIDDAFILKRVKSGLSSGEGLIFQVRDPQYDQVPIREGGRRTGEVLGYEDVLSDPGEPDKRLLIIESEFSSALKVMDREGNTLSPILRDV